jgi:hypothetical protein
MVYAREKEANTEYDFNAQNVYNEQLSTPFIRIVNKHGWKNTEIDLSSHLHFLIFFIIFERTLKQKKKYTHIN